MLCSFTKQVLAQLGSLDVNMSFAMLAYMDGSRRQPLKPLHLDRWRHQAILAISLDLAGSESFVRRCPVVKQHDMFQENFEHVPRILFARSCVLVGVFFRELL